MSKNLYKVANDLNSQLLELLYMHKQAAGEKEVPDDVKFRKQRNTNRIVEALTPLARTIAATIIGGAVGGPVGAAAGLGLGYAAEGAGSFIGGLSGAIKGGRTRDEQRAYDKEQQIKSLKQWLVPGYGTHQLTRRALRVQDALEDLPEQKA